MARAEGDSRLRRWGIGLLVLLLAYGLIAYIILPRAIRLGLRVLGRGHVPSYTTTGDGLPGDPVNLVLTGTPARGHRGAASPLDHAVPA